MTSPVAIGLRDSSKDELCLSNRRKAALPSMRADKILARNPSTPRMEKGEAGSTLEIVEKDSNQHHTRTDGGSEKKENRQGGVTEQGVTRVHLHKHGGTDDEGG